MRLSPACNDGYLSTGGGCLATATPSQASSKQTTQAAPSITTAAGTTTPQSLRTMVGSPLAATVGSSATIRASGAFSTDLDRVVLGVPVPETSPTPTPTTTKTTTTTTTTTTTSAHPTGTQCVVNADCDNSIPADSHNTCTWGFCGWGEQALATKLFEYVRLTTVFFQAATRATSSDSMEEAACRFTVRRAQSFNGLTASWNETLMCVF